MKIKNKKFLFITLNNNLFSRQKYIIDILKNNINIDIIFLENLFSKYTFFYKKGYYKNSFWPDSYSFQYFIFKKIFLENINPNNYSGLIITYDWSASIKRTIQIFNEYKIPTFNILHEGFFININDWYNMNKYLSIKLLLKTNKKLDIPISDFSFVWWEVHKKEFIKRGYKKYIKNVGTFKFEKYKKIKLNKSKILKKINFDIKKETFLYVFQILDEKLIFHQYNIINDLIEYCSINNKQLIIRNQLGYSLNINKLKVNNNIFIDGLKEYLLTAEESILLSDKIFAINSTMLLEGIYNNKDSFSFKYFNFHSPFLKENTIKTINNKKEIGKKINEIDNLYRLERTKEINKMQLTGNINAILNIINNNTIVINKKNKTNNKKYYLKYFYFLINPFLLKNLIQSFIIYIKTYEKNINNN